MSIEKKIANAHHEEAGSNTTRCTTHHGLGKNLAKAKYLANRRAKRVAQKLAFKIASL